MRIGVDIDGIVRDFVGAVRRQYRKDYPGHRIRQVTAWELKEFFPIGKGIYDYIWRDHRREIFLEAKPYPGAIAFTRRLQHLGHSVILVTTQKPRTEQFTISWILRHKPGYDGIVFSKPDQKAIADCDIFLDDAEHMLGAIWRAGKRVVCFDRPWNQGWSGERVKTYAEFLRLVKKAETGT